MKKKKKLFSFMMMSKIILFSVITVYGFAPISEPVVPGIDVSHWQGDIDFSGVAADGIEYVYIKAGEGTSYEDPKFMENYKSAVENKLKVGFYYYVTARTVDEGVAQAQQFALLLENLEYDLKPVMDFESFGALSKNEINEISMAFLETLLESVGQDVVIYGNYNTAKNVFDEQLADYPLWIAHYGVSEPGDPSKWAGWSGFQYSDAGQVTGISTSVDLNWFSENMLLEQNIVVDESSGENSEAAESGRYVPADENVADNSATEGQTDEVLYTVQWGDTLSKIARQYNVTVSVLVHDNNIANPDLIYVGEQLIIRIKSE